MKVIKKDGREVTYSKTNISTAIMNANMRIGLDKRLSIDEIKKITADIDSKVREGTHTISTSDIQDLVERALSVNYDVLKEYIQYRYAKELDSRQNTTDDSILSLLSNSNEIIKQENANKNPTIVSTMRDYMAGEVSKDISRRYLIPSDIWEAHKSGVIHFHDTDYFAMPIHNCCLVNLEDMLQNGTMISGVTIDRPNSFNTACNIATQIVAQVASSQYGGQTISLSHLAPFVDVSRKKFKKVLKEDFPDIDDARLNEIVEKRVKREIETGIQTLNYQLITLQTTNGQTPFVSVNMYLGEVSDPQTKADLALVIEEVLHQRILGVKNDRGEYIAPAFPKLLYVLEEDNITEDAPYWYLTKLAAECSAKRMVPDYISEKKMLEYKKDKKGEGHCYPCMGCVDGKSVVKIKVNDEVITTTIENMWNTYAKNIKHQFTEDNPNLYSEVENIEIYDNKKGFTKCLMINKNVGNDWILLKLKNKNVSAEVMCTANHIWTTVDGIDKTASELNENDKIYYSTENGLVALPIDTIISINNDAPSYDVTTETEHFEVNGLYSHNCRSFLTPYIEPKSKKAKYYGRFNQGVVTLNLVDVACASKKDMNLFWYMLNDRLELCHRALRVRHEHLRGVKSDVAPIMWQHGALARLKPGETIDSLLYNGYSTLSLGYAGLFECTKYMLGCSHTDEENGGKDFAMKVMQALNDACAKWKQVEKIDYSVYGTPIESTTYKFAQALQRKYGIIKDVTDHDYITNSYHVNVREQIDAFKKLDFEAPFQKLSPGGCISYVEVGNMVNNIPAVLEVIKYMYEHIMYAEINTKLDWCEHCGFQGELKIVQDEDGKTIWECPQCGCGHGDVTGNEGTDQDLLHPIRRVCGYISSNHFNSGRTSEIADRVLHL